jgi:hypothetical protein
VKTSNLSILLVPEVFPFRFMFRFPFSVLPYLSSLLDVFQFPARAILF